jgi:hypothetical protein
MVRATGQGASIGAGCPGIGAATATIGSTGIIGLANKLSRSLVKSLGPWAEFPLKGGFFWRFCEFHGVVKRLVADDSLQFRNVRAMRVVKIAGWPVSREFYGFRVFKWPDFNFFSRRFGLGLRRFRLFFLRRKIIS